MSYERGPLTLAIVPPSAVSVVWEDVEDAIDRAVRAAGGTHSIGDLYAEALDGRSQVWVVRSHGTFMAAAITRIVIYPQMRALSVEWIGGEDMDQWLDWWYGKLRDFAVVNECSCIEGTGRAGWARALKQFGMRPVATIYRAEV